MEVHGVCLVLGGVAGQSLVFFQNLCLFQRRFSLLPSAALVSACFLLFLLFLHLFYPLFICVSPFPSQPSLLEPPLVFPHRFYSLPGFAGFQLL